MGICDRVSGTVEPDYFQFYGARRGAAPDTTDYDDDDLAAHLFVDEGGVAIFTVRKFGTTPVEAEVWDEPPSPPSAEWQHVVDVSLVGGEGVFEVFDWHYGNEPALTIAIPTDPVRVRVCWAGLVADRFEGMTDDGDSDEHVRLQFWPADPSPRAVVRAWDGWPP